MSEFEAILERAARSGDDAVLCGITLSHIPVVFRGRVYTVHEHAKVLGAFGKSTAVPGIVSTVKSALKTVNKPDVKLSMSIALSERATAVAEAVRCKKNAGN